MTVRTIDQPRALMLAAPASGCGKTTITLALLRALSRNRHGVSAAKCGPDYIDPQYHVQACGNASLNLDPWAMDDDQLYRQIDVLTRMGASTVVVEAAMGLFDGAGIEGKGSAAELATRLDLPIVLIIDAARLSHSASLFHAGVIAHAPSLNIAGVIANRIASERHLGMVRGAIERTGMDFLGWMPRDESLSLPSRHLGLLLAREHPSLDQWLDRLADQAMKTLQVDRLLAGMTPLVSGPVAAPGRIMPPLGQVIAVAEDDAFAFAYPHILTAWSDQGATIRKFSPLEDEEPSKEADAIFLPGGYPELHAGTLSEARQFNFGMKAARDRDALIYGECGGYMVLGRAIRTRDGDYPMLGLLPHETSFANPRLQLGYREMTSCPGAPLEGHFAGHEFHYATLTGTTATPTLYHAMDAEGQHLADIGSSMGKVCGSFAHIICRR